MGNLDDPSRLLKICRDPPLGSATKISLEGGDVGLIRRVASGKTQFEELTQYRHGGFQHGFYFSSFRTVVETKQSEAPLINPGQPGVERRLKDIRLASLLDPIQ